MYRHVIFHDETYHIELEYVEFANEYFVHSQVYDWKPSTYKRFLVTFWDMMDMLAEKGIDHVCAQRIDDKLCKFAKMMGFSETDHVVETTEGLRTEVMICQPLQ